MPWSEWITSEPEPNSAIYIRGLSEKRFQVTGDVDLRNTIGDLRDLMRAEVTDEAETVVLFTQGTEERAETFEVASEILGSPGEYQADGTLRQRDWWVSTTEKFAPMGGLANLRQWSPPELNALEYGVDYGPRPDRNEDEDLDAYIEYDEGDAVRVGWQGIAQLSWWSSDPEEEPVHAEIRLESAWTPPTLPLVIPGETGDLWWSLTDPVTRLPVSGSFLAGFAGVGTDTPDDPVTFSGMLPDQEEFALVLVTPVYPDEFLPDFPDGYIWTRQQSVKADVDVSALIQYPRWRYWIPGDSYVRLLHRGDGLGMNPKRLRTGGTTNQAGRLRGSY